MATVAIAAMELRRKLRRVSGLWVFMIGCAMRDVAYLYLKRNRAIGSREDFPDHFAFDVGESDVASAEAIGQPFVMDSQLV